ncbi:DUF971 domain-containing protein [Simiduia sp. 21SJ11W-1]|uniref:gamma-butyrobetaine hydroxylase-like domain-containing protein n=1 Tax=Simiduia sp. 21SJ11W-1 TaxID=2909669 RepID=UPI0020A14DB0|nr:DUF971 domain-containing protein [Simiduia sp. 21SJ11W-1]UTA49616.1 DUF971 domain-containing protein [Simiduia sp. 21SJ11W-1]
MMPDKIKLHKSTRTLELVYQGTPYTLSAEFLRVHSPSAEVKGHGPGQAILQTGKREVALNKVEPVGSYALKLIFSDGHDSGIYTWQYLHDLATRHDHYWNAYLAQLHEAKATRDPDTSVVKFI